MFKRCLMAWLPSILAAIVATVMPAHADIKGYSWLWLSVCPQVIPAVVPGDSRRIVTYRPRPETTAIIVLDRKPVRFPATCSSRKLAVPLSQVVWFGRHTSAAWPPPRMFDVRFRESNGRLKVSAVTVVSRRVRKPAEAPKPKRVWRPIVPVETDLLAYMAANRFGRRERASVARRDAAVTLACRPGSDEAGLTLTLPDWSLRKRRGLSWSLEFTGSGPFRLMQGHGPAPGETDSAVRFPAAAGFASMPVRRSVAGRLRGLRVICPSEAATITLTTVLLKRARTEPAPMRSAWVWNPAQWRDKGKALLARALRFDVGVLYISVPIMSTRFDPARLRAFLAEARSRRIAVWAVEGDPHAVLPRGRAVFLKRTMALAAFNAAAAPHQRLAGVQFDIEPYLVPGYAADPRAWQRSYIYTIAALRRRAGMPVEVAIPYWFGRDGLGQQRLLDDLAPHVDSVAVMAYRTDPAQQQQAVEAIIAWGERRNRKVRVALENVALDDVVNVRHHNAARGRLWLVRLADTQVVLLLRGVRANPHGPAYRELTRWRLPAARITFNRRPDQLLKAATRLERALSGSPAFAGIGFHGLL